MSALPFRWSWAWTPFLVIGTAAIANTVMIVTSTRVRPQQVAINAYLDSKSFDALKAAQARFAAQDLRLDLTTAPGSATLAMTGAESPTGPLTVRAYRPDDAALDASTIWLDPTQPMTVQLTPGRWRLDITSEPGPEATAVTRQITIPGG